MSLLGASSLANILFNICYFFLHVYDSTKYQLTDDAKNVLFEAVIVFSIFLIKDFSKSIIYSPNKKQSINDTSSETH